VGASRIGAGEGKERFRKKGLGTLTRIFRGGLERNKFWLEREK